MKTTVGSAIVVLLLAAFAVQSAEPQRVALSVDPQRVLHRIDPKIYGQFLEHIYHSCNGGLWGDIIWNRSFEELPGGGAWRLEGEEIVQRTLAFQERLNFGNPGWGNYELCLEAQITGGNGHLALLCRVINNRDQIRINIGNRLQEMERLRPLPEGAMKRDVVGGRLENALVPGRWYAFKVRCEGPRIQVWMDEQRLFDFTETSTGNQKGSAAIGCSSLQARFRRVSVKGLDGKMLYDTLARLPQLSSQAKHWKPYGLGQTVTVEGQALNGEYCQRIVASTGETGVQQSSLCVRAGDSLRGSLWIRGNAQGTLVVRLLDGQAALVENKQAVSLGGWQEYPLELVSGKSVTNATLQIGFQGTGELWLDQVSLMADSSRATGGFRPDLLQAIEALRPPVIRWPGGSFASRYRWKDGVGPQHKRRSYPVAIWDDRDTNNLGTDEFLALCRRLKTEPMLVVNVGRWDPHAPSEQYLQEACDWVEYCNGPADSTWGRVRASNGHPEPYRVRYWQIDNEPWPMGSAKYGEAVKRFSQAMRKVDPDIAIIANGSLSFYEQNYDAIPGGLAWNKTLLSQYAEHFDYLDHHQYVKPDRYASAPKELEARLSELGAMIAASRNPRVGIFVGEWNLQSTDWRTGLFAGSLLNVFERTPAVKIATPALFLRHVSASGWDNAFINFDQSRWFPAPNYVVMKLWRDHYQPKRLALEGPSGALNATATLSEEGRSLIFKAVNPTEKPIELTLTVQPGFALERAAFTLVAPGSLEARNTLGAPDKVIPEQASVRCDGQTLHCTFPPLSAGVIAATGLPSVHSRRVSRDESASSDTVLGDQKLKTYVEQFNSVDPEPYTNTWSNAKALDFLAANIPRFECPDPDIERTYYFRWWTFRKHLLKTPVGWVITEFMPKVSWSGPYKTINCANGHHAMEGRWLRDARYVADNNRFWLKARHGAYSNWLLDALWNFCLVTGDYTLGTENLHALISFYKRWDGKRVKATGLYASVDLYDGMEESISGSGYRPTLNAYMYGNALAIARFAKKAGKNEIADEYTKKAAELKAAVQNNLWNEEHALFEVRGESHEPRAGNKNPALTGAEIPPFRQVREQLGYIPWYFSLPDPRYAGAWKHVADTNGFAAPWGLTTAEQRHPKFALEYKIQPCLWNGPVWPFATSQTLTSLANLLNSGPQDAVDRHTYYDALTTYAKSHRLLLPDGKMIPWIDESQDPYTGEWIAKTILEKLEKEHPEMMAKKGPSDRGKDYNHSTFCDLVINGLVGLRPQPDDTVVVNPLIPEGKWEYFCLEGVPYHGRLLTILWDKTGKRYNKGLGLCVFADNKELVRSETLQQLTVKMEPR